MITNHLTPFVYDSRIVDPYTVALHAQQEFIPSEILDIFGTQNKKTRKFNRTDLLVKVRWAGYSSHWDSWEPYSQLKTSDVFKKFCQDRRLDYLLDKRLDSSNCK